MGFTPVITSYHIHRLQALLQDRTLLLFGPALALHTEKSMQIFKKVPMHTLRSNNKNNHNNNMSFESSFLIHFESPDGEKNSEAVKLTGTGGPTVENFILPHSLILLLPYFSSLQLLSSTPPLPLYPPPISHLKTISFLPIEVLLANAAVE